MSLMNDPHVAALTYLVKHDDHFDYSEAKPIDQEKEEFQLKVKDKIARFEFKNHVHYATEKHAREAVEDFIRIWEFEIGLERGPGFFSLRFHSAEIVDRNPSTNSITGMVSDPGLQLNASVTVRYPISNYPLPPSDLRLNVSNENVWLMHRRYMDDYRHPNRLTSMAQFCLTALGRSKGGLEKAAHWYQIEHALLRHIGNICNNRGGPRGARKAAGVHTDLSDWERHFLHEAVKQIIRRAAEKFHDPDHDFPVIRKSDIESNLETA